MFRKFNKYDDIIAKYDGFTDPDIYRKKALAQSGLTQKMYEYVTSLGVSSSAEMTFMQKLKLSTMALKEQAIAWAASPLGMATIVAVSIFAIVKAIDYFHVSVEEANEQIAELDEEMKTLTNDIQSVSTEFRNLKKSADDVIPRFAKLAQGVNSFGENVSLTDEEYSEFLSLNNQIAEMFPEINNGMDENGNAMLSLSLTSDTLTESLNALVEAQRAVTNEKIAEKLPEVLENAKNADKDYDTLLENAAAERQKLIDLYSKIQNLEPGKAVEFTMTSGADTTKLLSEEALAKQLGVTINREIVGGTGRESVYEVTYDFDMSEVTRNYENALAGLEWELHDLEERAANRWNNVNPVVSAWMQTDFMYQDLDDNMQTVVKTMVSGLDFSELGYTTQEEVENYIHNYIVGPLYGAGEEVESAFESITDWRTKLQNGEITFQQFSDNVTAAFEMLLSSMSPGSQELFKTAFVNGFKEAGVAGEDYTSVLSGVISEWGRTSEAATTAAESVNIFANATDQIDATKESMEQITEAIGKLASGSLQVWDVVELIQKFPELLQYVDFAAKDFGKLGDGLQHVLQNSPEPLINELQNLKQTNGLVGEAAKQVDNLCDSLARLADVVDPSVDEFVGSLSKIQQATSGLDLLGGIYADVADGETFDWSSVLNNEEFTKQFGNLGVAYTDFIKTVSASNGDLKACQAAFDELTTAYIMNSEVLNEVTAETRDASVALLEEMGVANAAALVDAKLADNLVYLSEQTKTYVSTLLTEEQVLWDECEAGSAAAQSLANLVQQKLAFNASTINTTNDIKQLMNLAKYANATSASIQRLAKAEEFMSQYYAMKDKNYSYAVSFLHQANDLLSMPIEYEEYTANVVAKVEYSGGSEYLQKLKDETEKAAKDAEKAREDALKNAKSSIDELVEYRIDMLKKDIELEKDALDEKLDALKDFYDKQKEMLQDQYDEEQYLKEQKEKRESVSDIEAELARLDFDDSAWAQKRKLELREELVDAKDELQEFEDEHALDLALDALDDALQSQEAQIQAEMDALDDRLNDPHALFNQALNDIKTNTGALYNEMVIYNRKYGSGNDEDIADMYKEAQDALSEYKSIYGSNYKGVMLSSPSGGISGGGTTDPSGGSSSDTVSKGETVTVKKTATHYGSKSGGKEMASFVPGGTYTVYKTSSDQVLIGRNGSYTGWVKKSDIVGYASGTPDALPGFKQIDETGAEYTFVSSDGSRYRIFSGGEKVLNAKATNFLYDFATTGGAVISNMMSNIANAIGLGKISKPSQTISLSTGNIIIQGNADSRTVSEIRRAQRDNLEFIIKEFNKLNK